MLRQTQSKARGISELITCSPASKHFQTHTCSRSTWHEQEQTEYNTHINTPWVGVCCCYKQIHTDRETDRLTHTDRNIPHTVQVAIPPEYQHDCSLIALGLFEGLTMGVKYWEEFVYSSLPHVGLHGVKHLSWGFISWIVRGHWLPRHNGYVARFFVCRLMMNWERPYTVDALSMTQNSCWSMMFRLSYQATTEKVREDSASVEKSFNFLQKYRHCRPF